VSSEYENVDKRYRQRPLRLGTKDSHQMPKIRRDRILRDSEEPVAPLFTNNSR
jgi:hypothetical protein